MNKRKTKNVPEKKGEIRAHKWLFWLWKQYKKNKNSNKKDKLLDLFSDFTTQLKYIVLWNNRPNITLNDEI
jgi:hypothetical protein